MLTDIDVLKNRYKEVRQKQSKWEKQFEKKKGRSPSSSDKMSSKTRLEYESKCKQLKAAYEKKKGALGGGGGALDTDKKQ